MRMIKMKMSQEKRILECRILDVGNVISETTSCAIQNSSTAHNNSINNCIDKCT